MNSPECTEGQKIPRRTAELLLLCAVVTSVTVGCGPLSTPYSCTDAGRASTVTLQEELKSRFSSITRSEAISDCDSGGELVAMFGLTSFEAADKEFAAAPACRPKGPAIPDAAEGVRYRCKFQTVSADIFLVRYPQTASEAVVRRD